MYWWEFFGGVYGFLLFVVLGFCLNRMRYLPRLYNVNGGDEGPLVSIIVPVKDEEDTIGECLSSLVNVRYRSKEIIVVLGESRDGTEEIVRGFGDRVRVVYEGSLPDGWVGKNWACYVGYRYASGELLLFTDGDTIHSEDSLSKVVGVVLGEGADMVTLFPKFVFRSFWEKLVTPLIAIFIGISNRVWELNDDSSSSFLGNGQYLLIRHDVYERIGGHRSVRDIVIEDYALAGLVKKYRYRLRGYYAPELLRVKMYRSFSELWEGWTKNIYSGVGGVWNVIMLIFVFLGLLLPYVFVVFALLQFVNGVLSLLVFNVLPVFLLFVAGVVVYRSYDVGIFYAFLVPFGILIIVVLIFDSMLRSVLWGVSWKGRKYFKVRSVKEFLNSIDVFE